MYRKYALSCAVLVASHLSAQVTEGEATLRSQSADSLDGWKKGGLISLNLSQVSLTNWNAGGQNSISANGLVSLYAHYSKGKTRWENTLDLGYGILRQGRKNNASWIKTDDKIDLVSKFGRKASEKWLYSALLNFNTQASPGYSYPDDSTVISRFMAPGYLLFAAGMDYKPHPSFSAFIAPLTMKSTFVNDQRLADAGAFGVDSSKKARIEMGGYARFQYEREIAKNIRLNSRLSLFSNYFFHPERIDVNWETLIQFKVNRFITATISTHLIYDHDIAIAVFDDDGLQVGEGPRLQFKEVLGIGFAYRF